MKLYVPRTSTSRKSSAIVCRSNCYRKLEVVKMNDEVQSLSAELKEKYNFSNVSEAYSEVMHAKILMSE